MRKFLIYFIFIVLLFSLSMTGCGKNNSTNYTTVTVDPGNVIYYGNTNDGGAVPIDDNDYEIGDIVTVKHNENYLVKDFKKFTGWNTQSDGSGDSYQPEDNITVEDENNIELYAQWDNSPYKISSGGEILDYDSLSGSDVSIPEEIGEVPITIIGNSAFQNKSLTSVNIHTSITAIGNNAFLNNNLTTLTIPNNVDSIGDNAFASNTLTSIDLPDTIDNLGVGAFQYNSLTTVEIPQGIETIPNYLFQNNDITDLVIPDNILYIGDQAFWENDISNLTLSNNLITIRMGAFGNNLLTTVTFPSSLETIEANVFQESVITEVEIGASVNINSATDTMGDYGEDFFNFYDSNGKIGGVYQYNSGSWEYIGAGD